MTEENVVLYVMVVGFHHKKGCQLEYCYPSLGLDDTNTVDTSSGDPELHLPEPWKNLPSLSLPDGAHRYESDTTFFHLPSLTHPDRTVFGVSCYRQIDANSLRVKESDVTRETVQKSVCVISRLPLYGIIEAKLSLITHAYFEERDFSKVQLLEDTFNQLNESLHDKLLNESQIFVGLSVRDLVARFKHKIVLLFKLVLLERKVLFYTSPVKLLTSSMLSLLSLFPEMIEHGLIQSACKDLSESFEKDGTDSNSNTVSVPDDQPQLFRSEMNLLEEISSELGVSDGQGDFSQAHLELAESVDDEKRTTNPSDVPGTGEELEQDVVVIPIDKKTQRVFPVKPSLPVKDDYGFPLEIFTQGYLCHPYLSLAYFDLVSDPSIPGYLVGATNPLFHHNHKKFADVLVDASEGRIEIHDLELRRQLNLTMEDLRFAEHIVQMVSSEGTQGNRASVFDGTGWEGGEEWIRSQFRNYLLCMFGSASKCSALDKGQKEVLDSYNYQFVSAWRKTKNFRILNENLPKLANEFAMGHPFAGEYNVLDIKTKFNSLITPERAKKINATVSAVNETSKVVAERTKSIGGTISSWLSSMRKDQ